MSLEYCFICQDPTGRAGRAEDSIYIGDTGPYCEECYARLIEDVRDRVESHTARRILTRCPACGNDTLTINEGHLLCTWHKCPNPTEIDEIGEHAKPISLPELTVTEEKDCPPGFYRMEGANTGVISSAPWILQIMESVYPKGFVINWNIGPKRHEIAKELLAKQP